MEYGTVAILAQDPLAIMKFFFGVAVAAALLRRQPWKGFEKEEPTGPVVMEYGTKGRPDSARAVEATEPVEAYENTVEKYESAGDVTESASALTFGSATEACVHCFGSYTYQETFVQPYKAIPNCVCMSVPEGGGHEMYCSKAGTPAEMDWLKSKEGCICRKSLPPLGEPGCLAPEDSDADSMAERNKIRESDPYMA